MLNRIGTSPLAKALTVIVTSIVFGTVSFPEGARAVTNADCFSESFSVTKQVNHQNFEEFLDCLSAARPLSLAGAQWIILRKGHWRIADGASISLRQDYRVAFAQNPADPQQSHKLYLNFRGLEATRGNIQAFVNTLEQSIFPKALRGFTDEPARNLTAVSYAHTTHHYIAFADFAMGTWKRKYGGETKNRHYPGTLAVSNLFSSTWYDRAVNDFPYIAPVAPEKDMHWAELRKRYEGMGYCEQTYCFTRQERKVIQGLFFSLSNPDLVDAVHFTRHQGFGKQTGTYAGAQESLPQRYGCLTGTVFDYATTGWNEFDYSGTSYPEAYLDLSQFGKWGLLGQTIYIEAMNKGEIRKTGYPGQFQGQNSIIRSISDRAVANLKELGGFGDERIEHVASPSSDGSADVGSTSIDSIPEIIRTKLSGVSKLIAEYHYERYQYELRYIADQRARGSSKSEAQLWKDALAASETAFASHAVNTEPFFTETIITKGWSMKFWVNLLHKLNPPVSYFIFMNVLGLRPKEAYFNTWDTYYDRLLFVLENNYLPSLQL